MRGKRPATLDCMHTHAPSSGTSPAQSNSTRSVELPSKRGGPLASCGSGVDSPAPSRHHYVAEPVDDSIQHSGADLKQHRSVSAHCGSHKALGKVDYCEFCRVTSWCPSSYQPPYRNSSGLAPSPWCTRCASKSGRCELARNHVHLRNPALCGPVASTGRTFCMGVLPRCFENCGRISHSCSQHSTPHSDCKRCMGSIDFGRESPQKDVPPYLPSARKQNELCLSGALRLVCPQVSLSIPRSLRGSRVLHLGMDGIPPHLIIKLTHHKSMNMLHRYRRWGLADAHAMNLVYNLDQSKFSENADGSTRNLGWHSNIVTLHYCHYVLRLYILHF